MKRIYNRRHYLKKKLVGTFSKNYRNAETLLRSGGMKYLKLIYSDPSEEIISFLIYDSRIYSNKSIHTIYCDGTFKTKKRGGESYKVVCFAKNMPIVYHTIPISFTISSKATHNEYKLSWDRLILVLKKLGVDISFLTMVSDEGSAEVKFNRLIKELIQYYLCWFHVLVKNLIPKMKILGDSNIKDDLIKMIKRVYVAKNFTRRRVMVKRLKKFLKKKGEREYLNYLERYLTDDMLDRWTCLRKLSIYSQHSNNYIEKFFNEVSFFAFIQKIDFNHF